MFVGIGIITALPNSRMLTSFLTDATSCTTFCCAYVDDVSRVTVPTAYRYDVLLYPYVRYGTTTGGTSGGQRHVGGTGETHTNDRPRLYPRRHPSCLQSSPSQTPRRAPPACVAADDFVGLAGTSSSANHQHECAGLRLRQIASIRC